MIKPTLSTSARCGITFLHLAFVFLLASCTGKQTAESTAESSMDEGTQTYTFTDSCQHLTMSLSLEVPVGKDSASIQICDSLVAEFIRSINNSGYGDEDGETISPCAYNRDDIQSLVDYYGRATYQDLLKMALDDYKERMAYLAEDSDLTDEEREQFMNDFPQWEFYLDINRITETDAFVVYNSDSYRYYGGAHGGVVGTGPITFDKSTGSKIERFILDNSTFSMQPLLRKGLLQYFCENGDTITDQQLPDRLFIDGNVIPLPGRTPYPNATADSLIFIYSQYEIACYADGMPSFSLPIKDLLPYLTPEAKAIIKTEDHQNKSAQKL